MDEHTSHELAYKKGYDKGYRKGYDDAVKYALLTIKDIEIKVKAIEKNVTAMLRLAEQEPEPPKGECCMKCRFEHDEDCCNSGATQYMCKCKQPCDTIVPMTNADRLRDMTDEELCEFLSQYKFCDICEEGCTDCTYHGDCDKRLLDWLQQPAEGDA